MDKERRVGGGGGGPTPRPTNQIRRLLLLDFRYGASTPHFQPLTPPLLFTKFSEFSYFIFFPFDNEFFDLDLNHSENGYWDFSMEWPPAPWRAGS